eukprot:TRINITY_DN9391_c0_g3_i3.p2 TRINITY_DN9391_c0_g3~~TRINITY_DN9391_c0_g3_i3.p2  ORF type:complete len:200 (-),score=45.52 TRINITY_DN9391_c0_g3_i3:615-1214(-)
MCIRDRYTGASYILDDSSSNEEACPESEEVPRVCAVPSGVKGSEGRFSETKGCSKGIFAAGSLSAKRLPHTLQTPMEKGGSRILGTDSLGSRRTCNCKRSNCLKLYCDCFASGDYCKNCNCTSCCNNPHKETLRSSAIRSVLDRNPGAFRPKIDPATPSPDFHDSDLSLQKRHCKVCLLPCVGMRLQTFRVFEEVLRVF